MILQGPSGRSGCSNSVRLRKAFSGRNGSYSEPQAPDRVHSKRDLAELQREVADLRQVVATQGKLVKDQVSSLKVLS